MRLFLFFLISAIFFSFRSFGQADSTFTDTVVIIKDPHIIRQEVIIQQPSETKKTIPPIIIGLNLGLGKLDANPGPIEIEANSTIYKNYELNVGYIVKNIIFSVGIGSFNTSLSHISSRQELIIDYETKIEDTLIATYYLDGQKYTVTEPDTNIYQYTRSVNHIGECTSSIKYIQFPLTLGYHIKLRNSKLAIIPGLQIILNKKRNPTEVNYYEQKIASVFYGINLKVEYSITPKLFFNINSSLQHQYGSVYKNSMKENWVMNGIGLGINYRL